VVFVTFVLSKYLFPIGRTGPALGRLTDRLCGKKKEKAKPDLLFSLSSFLYGLRKIFNLKVKVVAIIISRFRIH